MLIFAIANSAFSAVYHIDPFEGDSKNDGTAQAPLKKWTDLPRMQPGDDVFFKCGTNSFATESLNIYWEGSNSNPVVIGAYDTMNGKPIYGVDGRHRPIINGSNYSVPSNDAFGGLIEIKSKDYIVIKDLHIYESGRHGILISGDLVKGTNSAFFKIINVKIEGAFDAGILINKNPKNYGLIEGCEISGTAYGWKIKHPSFSTWPVTLFSNESPYANITIRRNFIHQNWGEGIGSGRVGYGIDTDNSGYATIEENIIWNNRRVDIYLSRTEQNIVRRNVCLGANDSNFSSTVEDGRHWNQMGIWINTEKRNDNGRTKSVTHNNKIYNNLVAGHNKGIGLGTAYTNGEMIDNFFYNNTLIGNRYNWYVVKNISTYKTSGIELKNNISYCPSDTTCQDVVNDPSWFDTKINADYNAWSKKPDNFGGSNDRLVSDDWTKIKGWQNLKQIPAATDFMPLKGNPVIGGGVPLSHEFQGGISATNTVYQVSPLNILVSTIKYDIDIKKWDMGAVPYQGEGYLNSPILSIVAGN
jgi:parallel beta-helix repeat protein